MKQNSQNLLNHLSLIEPPPNLFERIIAAIKREEERRQTKKLLFSFLVLLLISLLATPISFLTLLTQLKSSGLYYFISAALGDLGNFFKFWQDFVLAILESLPMAAIVFFGLSLATAVFTLRLFLYKKRLLFNYLTFKFAK